MESGTFSDGWYDSATKTARINKFASDTTIVEDAVHELTHARQYARPETRIAKDFEKTTRIPLSDNQKYSKYEDWLRKLDPNSPPLVIRSIEPGYIPYAVSDSLSGSLTEKLHRLQPIERGPYKAQETAYKAYAKYLQLIGEK